MKFSSASFVCALRRSIQSHGHYWTPFLETNCHFIRRKAGLNLTRFPQLVTINRRRILTVKVGRNFPFSRDRR